MFDKKHDKNKETMKTLQMLTAFAAVVCFGGAQLARADFSIVGDPNAPTGNFGSPGTTATVAYAGQVSDDGTNFLVFLQSLDPQALPFANLYFDTIASTPNTGSNLGFEFGQNAATNNAFIPGVPGSNILITGTGVSALFTVTGNETDIAITIPNTFFINNPLSMPFAPTPNGTLVSLHLSQSFGYSVVGGGANYAPPVELGDAVVSLPVTTPTPEPALYGLLGLGIGGLVLVRPRRTSYQK